MAAASTTPVGVTALTATAGAMDDPVATAPTLHVLQDLDKCDHSNSFINDAEIGDEKFEEEEEQEEWDSEDKEDEDEPYHEYAERYDIDIKKKPHRRPIRPPPPPPLPPAAPLYSHHRTLFDNDTLGLIFLFVSHHHVEDFKRVNRQWMRVAAVRASARAAIFDAQFIYPQLLAQHFKPSPNYPPALPKKVVSLSLDQHHNLRDTLCATNYPDLTSLSYQTTHWRNYSLEPPEFIPTEDYHRTHAGTLSNQLLTLILDPEYRTCHHFPPLDSFLCLRVLIIKSGPSDLCSSFSDFSGLSLLHSLECFTYSRSLGTTDKVCGVLRYLSSQHALRRIDINIVAQKLKPIYARTRILREEDKREDPEEVKLFDFIDPTSTKLLPHSRLTHLTVRVCVWNRAYTESIFLNLPNLRHFACHHTGAMKTDVDGVLAPTTNQNQMTTATNLESMLITICHRFDQQRMEQFTNLRILNITLYELYPVGCLSWMHSLRYLQELTLSVHRHEEKLDAEAIFAPLSSLISLERLSFLMSLKVHHLDAIAGYVSTLPHFLVLRLEESRSTYLSLAFLTSMSQSRMWRRERLDSKQFQFPQQTDGFRSGMPPAFFSSPAMQQFRIIRYRTGVRMFWPERRPYHLIDFFQLAQKSTKGRYRWKLVQAEKQR